MFLYTVLPTVFFNINNQLVMSIKEKLDVDKFNNFSSDMDNVKSLLSTICNKYEIKDGISVHLRDSKIFAAYGSIFENFITP